MIDRLFESFRKGDRLALSRLLSRAARGQELHDIAAHMVLPPHPGKVLAFTGSAGVGKSTLIGKLIEHLRRQGLKVAVLACDPQSPLSGGALLGDRFRMPSFPGDNGVFIRSLAAPSGTGAVAEHLSLMVRLCQAFGFDVTIIETVGAGQGDTAVRDQADVLALLVQPETGDDLQWEKAGVFEVADLVVIHKADLPGADRVAAQVQAMMELSARPIPVLRVSAKTGEGIDALWQAIQAAGSQRGPALDGRELLHLAQQALADRFAAALEAGNPDLKRILDLCRQGKITPEEAGEEILNFLKEPRKS